jgi:hypothetical protein
MDQLQVSARFPRITPENLDEFKRVAAQALEITKGDAGTLQYDWFLNADETVCEVHEGLCRLGCCARTYDGIGRTGYLIDRARRRH